MANSVVLEVLKSDLTRLRSVEEALPETLRPGQVLLAVDHFALTSNNITYCQVGEQLGYWRFFPTSDAAWGRVPAMGYADVIASEHDEVRPGERVWGFFPMGSHLLIEAGRVGEHGFSDVSQHREGLAPVYAQFQRAANNPIYVPGREAQDCLLRGLFLTFCESLGCYDEVVTYDDTEALPATGEGLLIDMAGNAAVNAAIHRHYGDRLIADYRIGITHHDAAPAADDELPGPEPEWFFAPHQAQRRSREWGAAQLEARVAGDFAAFREFCDGWLEVRKVRGEGAAREAFLALLAGKVAPETGYSVSLAAEG